MDNNYSRRLEEDASGVQVEESQHLPLAAIVVPRRPKKAPAQCNLLLNMPVDVVIEVFMCLRPRDLVALIRTSKHLRSVLLSRGTSLWVWRAALHNQSRSGPPLVRPLHVSEVRWACIISGEMGLVCIKCKRTYSHKGLLSHFRDKHKNLAPLYDQEWVEKTASCVEQTAPCTEMTVSKAGKRRWNGRLQFFQKLWRTVRRSTPP